jgi:hypothetical protein
MRHGTRARHTGALWSPRPSNSHGQGHIDHGHDAEYGHRAQHGNSTMQGYGAEEA